MKILVTGGDGFIMSHYKKAIKKEGHEFISYDLPDNDILDTGNLDCAIANCDAVLHSAAMADLTVCIKELEKNHDVNVNGTFNVARLCAKHDKKLIFISTCCVYGNILDEIALEDTTQPQAAEPYATSKVAGEAIIKGMPNLQYVILRIGTVYGVGMRPALFTWIVLNAARTGKKIFVDGDGLQTRQTIYINDLIDGIVKATVKLDDIMYQTINLCGNTKISALDCIVVAEKIIDKPVNFEHRIQRYGQTLDENISIEKAGKLLDWYPNTSFIDGMKYAYNNDGSFS